LPGQVQENLVGVVNPLIQIAIEPRL
jgi:hypothetical protein